MSYDEYKITRGTDNVSNYMPACRMCNFRKGTSDIETFRKEIMNQAKGVMKTFQGRMSEAYGLIEFHNLGQVKFFFEEYQDTASIREVQHPYIYRLNGKLIDE